MIFNKLYVRMREVALVVDIVCRVLFHLKSVTDATKKVIRDELGEAVWVAHEELVTGARQNVQLALAGGEEGIGTHDFTKAS